MVLGLLYLHQLPLLQLVLVVPVVRVVQRVQKTLAAQPGQEIQYFPCLPWPQSGLVTLGFLPAPVFQTLPGLHWLPVDLYLPVYQIHLEDQLDRLVLLDQETLNHPEVLGLLESQRVLGILSLPLLQSIL